VSVPEPEAQSASQGPAVELPAPTGGSPLRRAVRGIFLAVALVLCVLVIWRNREDFAAALGDMSPWSLLLAGGAALAAGIVPMLGWRVLMADLGSKLPLGAAGRIYFVGQLGKYIPGSVWTVLAQVELAREYRVPVRRSGSVALLSLITALFSALLVGALALPFSTPALRDEYWWIVLLLPPMLVLLHPAVVNRWSVLLFRLLRRPADPGRLHGGAVAQSVGWMVLAWVLYGVHLYWLGADTAEGDVGPGTLAQCLGVFAVGWVVGFLLVVLPAGAGARELIIVVGLASVLPSGAALAVALVSRVLLTAVDLLLAVLAIARYRVLRARAAR